MRSVRGEAVQGDRTFINPLRPLLSMYRLVAVSFSLRSMEATNLPGRYLCTYSHVCTVITVCLIRGRRTGFHLTGTYLLEPFKCTN